MLSIEELSAEVEKISKVAQDTHKQVTTMMEIKNKDHPLHEGKANNDDDKHEGQNDDDKNHEGKSGMDDDEHKAQNDEKEKEARKARYNAVKLAMEEDDEEKRDAAIKSAMKANGQDPMQNTTTNVKEATDEEKEQDAAVASIIGDKRAEYIQKILSANRLFNASNIESVEKRVRKASLTSLKKEYKTILPFIGGAKAEQAPAAQPPVIPYFASMMNPQEIDASQLNASSPDSAFAKLTTKELLEMAN